MESERARGDNHHVGFVISFHERSTNRESTIMQRAAVAVRGLREDAHHGKKYLLSGPESLTLVEQVQTIAEEIGRLV
jgi:hypothetical protein